MPSIKCKVTECSYNKDVACNAPMVEVDHNKTNMASSSDHTQCQTFKPKM